MEIISQTIEKEIIIKNYCNIFQNMIKTVVDIEKEIIAIDAELHADLEALLLSKESKQEHLWGINLYLEKDISDWIEYTALINIRPSFNNKSMEVEDLKIRKRIEDIIKKLIVK